MSAPVVSPLECWLPAWSRFDGASPWRTGMLRADRLPAGPPGYLAGLASHFQGVGDSLPAAALTRDYLLGDAGDASWLGADPAWVQPDRNGARLLACGQLRLSMPEALALAAPLLPVFEEAGMRLEVSSPDRWHLRLPSDIPLPAFDAPEQAMGEDLFLHLPQGPEGRRWRILLNEVQVLLHQHPLNAERRTRGLPPINSVWLWGGGRLPAQLRSDLRGVIGDDLLLCALARRAGVAQQARRVEAVAQAGAGWLLDLQDVAVDELESVWWPALQVAGRQQALCYAFASGERWLHKPWHRLRVWRKAGSAKATRGAVA